MSIFTMYFKKINYLIMPDQLQIIFGSFRKDDFTLLLRKLLSVMKDKMINILFKSIMFLLTLHSE